MGQSTNAIIFYGVTWDDEHILFEDRDGETRDWPEILAVRRGISNPWNFYRDIGAEAEHSSLPYEQQRGAFAGWEAEVGFEAMLDKWRADVKAIRAEFDVDVSSHCSCNYPIPYIYITGTETTSYRGDSKEIRPVDMAMSPLTDWNDELTRFATELNIDLFDAKGPAWFLVSNWC